MKKILVVCCLFFVGCNVEAREKQEQEEKLHTAKMRINPMYAAMHSELLQRGLTEQEARQKADEYAYVPWAVRNMSEKKYSLVRSFPSSEFSMHGGASIGDGSVLGGRMWSIMGSAFLDGSQDLILYFAWAYPDTKQEEVVISKLSARRVRVVFSEKVETPTIQFIWKNPPHRAEAGCWTFTKPDFVELFSCVEYALIKINRKDWPPSLNPIQLPMSNQ